MCDPSQTCLRSLQGIRRSENDGEITYEGQYVNDRAQWFSLAVTADDKHDESMNDLMSEMRVCFEAIPEGEHFEDPSAEVGDPPDEAPEPEMFFTMKLERAPGIEAENLVCGFLVDPDIDFDEVCAWKPTSPATWRVQMHVSAGRAQLRVPERNFVVQNALGNKDTPWLRTDNTWVRVRGLQNGSSYYLRGGWKQARPG
jgi:hypothetical protein